MWYFAWVLGMGVALTFGVLNAMWFEMRHQDAKTGQGSSALTSPD